MEKPFYSSFLGLDENHSLWAKANYAIIQASFEKSTRLQHGTAQGPQALLRASEHVSRWDMFFQKDFSTVGIHTLPPLDLHSLSSSEALTKIEEQCSLCLDNKKWPLLIGGEQSVSLAALRALTKNKSTVSVLSLDSRVDALDKVLGSSSSHLSCSRRLLESGVPTHVWGYRALEVEEALFLKNSPSHFFALSQKDLLLALQKKSLPQLATQEIFLNVDLSVLDPATCPAVSRPEPSGLSWQELCELLIFIFDSYTVVGASLCELAPIPNDTRSEYLAAQLAYKIIACHQSLNNA
jgi:agmatinase